jgi:hypothetical protein
MLKQPDTRGAMNLRNREAYTGLGFIGVFEKFFTNLDVIEVFKPSGRDSRGPDTGSLILAIISVEPGFGQYLINGFTAITAKILIIEFDEVIAAILPAMITYCRFAGSCFHPTINNSKAN